MEAWAVVTRGGRRQLGPVSPWLSQAVSPTSSVSALEVKPLPWAPPRSVPAAVPGAW